MSIKIINIPAGAEKPKQTKTVSPSDDLQQISPDAGYELESITIEAVPTEIGSASSNGTLNAPTGKWFKQVNVNVPAPSQETLVAPTFSLSSDKKSIIVTDVSDKAEFVSFTLNTTQEHAVAFSGSVQSGHRSVAYSFSSDDLKALYGSSSSIVTINITGAYASASGYNNSTTTTASNIASIGKATLDYGNSRLDEIYFITGITFDNFCNSKLNSSTIVTFSDDTHIFLNSSSSYYINNATKSTQIANGTTYTFNNVIPAPSDIIVSSDKLSFIISDVSGFGTNFAQVTVTANAQSYTYPAQPSQAPFMLTSSMLSDWYHEYSSSYKLTAVSAYLFNTDSDSIPSSSVTMAAAELPIIGRSTIDDELGTNQIYYLVGTTWENFCLVYDNLYIDANDNYIYRDSSKKYKLINIATGDYILKTAAISSAINYGFDKILKIPTISISDNTVTVVRNSADSISTGTVVIFSCAGGISIEKTANYQGGFVGVLLTSAELGAFDGQSQIYVKAKSISNNANYLDSGYTTAQYLPGVRHIKVDNEITYVYSGMTWAQLLADANLNVNNYVAVNNTICRSNATSNKPLYLVASTPVLQTPSTTIVSGNYEFCLNSISAPTVSMNSDHTKLVIIDPDGEADFATITFYNDMSGYSYSVENVLFFDDTSSQSVIRKAEYEFNNADLVAASDADLTEFMFNVKSNVDNIIHTTSSTSVFPSSDYFYVSVFRLETVANKYYFIDAGANTVTWEAYCNSKKLNVFGLCLGASDSYIYKYSTQQDPYFRLKEYSVDEYVLKTDKVLDGTYIFGEPVLVTPTISFGGSGQNRYLEVDMRAETRTTIDATNISVKLYTAYENKAKWVSVTATSTTKVFRYYLTHNDINSLDTFNTFTLRAKAKVSVNGFVDAESSVASLNMYLSYITDNNSSSQVNIYYFSADATSWSDYCSSSNMNSGLVVDSTRVRPNYDSRKIVSTSLLSVAPTDYIDNTESYFITVEGLSDPRFISSGNVVYAKVDKDGMPLVTDEFVNFNCINGSLAHTQYDSNDAATLYYTQYILGQVYNSSDKKLYAKSCAPEYSSSNNIIVLNNDVGCLTAANNGITAQNIYYIQGCTWGQLLSNTELSYELNEGGAFWSIDSGEVWYWTGTSGGAGAWVRVYYSSNQQHVLATDQIQNVAISGAF